MYVNFRLQLYVQNKPCKVCVLCSESISVQHMVSVDALWQSASEVLRVAKWRLEVKWSSQMLWDVDNEMEEKGYLISFQALMSICSHAHWDCFNLNPKSSEYDWYEQMYTEQKFKCNMWSVGPMFHDLK